MAPWATLSAEERGHFRNVLVPDAGDAQGLQVAPSGAVLAVAEASTPGYAARYVRIARLSFSGEGHLAEQAWQHVGVTRAYADDAEMAAWLAGYR